MSCDSASTWRPTRVSMQKPVHALVAPHGDVGDGVDPQPRSFAAADAAVEQIDIRRNFGEQRIERLVEEFKPRHIRRRACRRRRWYARRPRRAPDASPLSAVTLPRRPPAAPVLRFRPHIPFVPCATIHQRRGHSKARKGLQARKWPAEIGIDGSESHAGSAEEPIRTTRRPRRSVRHRPRRYCRSGIRRRWRPGTARRWRCPAPSPGGRAAQWQRISRAGRGAGPRKLGNSGVSVATGAMAQTRMRSGASSPASPLVSVCTAPLVAHRPTVPGRGRNPAVEPILMMTPPPACGTAAPPPGSRETRL